MQNNEISSTKESRVNLKKNPNKLSTHHQLLSAKYMTHYTAIQMYFIFYVFCLLESNIAKIELQLHMKELIFTDGGVTEISFYYLQ